MSEQSTFKIGLTVVAALIIALGFMVACAYLWVFIYSVAIYSDGNAAYYEAYAQTASPVVAVILSGPVFYLVGRYMRRFGDKAMVAAFSVVGLNLVLDVMAVSSMADDLGYHAIMSTVAALAKIAGAYFGSKPQAPAPVSG